MRKQVWKETVSADELPYLIKGLRYTLGYSLCDTKELGFDVGLVSNWESKLCGPNKENWTKIKLLIKQSEKTIDELIQIGKIDFSLLMKKIMTKLNIPEEIFIRFITSKLSWLGTRKKFHEFLDNKFGLSAKNKSKLIFIKDLLRKYTDPRKAIFEFQKEYSNRNKNFQLEFLNNASQYEEIVTLSPRNSRWEGEVFQLLKPLLKDLVRNAVVSSRNFEYITEVDICGKHNGKKIFVLCKDCDAKKLVNLKRIINKKIELIRKFIKPDFVWLIVSCKKIHSKMIFENKNTFLLTKEDLIRLNRSPKTIKDFFVQKKEKNVSKLKLDVNRGSVFRNLRTITKLSRLQLSVLLGISLRYLEKLEKSNSNLTEKMKERVENFIKKYKNIKDIRKLHFLANKKISNENKEGLLFHHMRKQLEMSIRDLSENIDIPAQWITNYEAGRLRYRKVGEKIHSFFRSMPNYKTLRENAEKEVKIHKNVWKKASKHKEIINIRRGPVKGKELEDFIINIVSDLGYEIIPNPVVATKDITYKKEVDALIFKNDFKAIVECEERRNDVKWQDKCMVLQDLKNICKNVVFVSDNNTEFSKEIFKKNGIIALTKSEVKSFFSAR